MRDPTPADFTGDWINEAAETLKRAYESAETKDPRLAGFNRRARRALIAQLKREAKRERHARG